MADTLVSNFDLIEFLELVAVRSTELAQSTAAGLLLADPDDRLQFMAASDENTGPLELFQVQHSEGPCLDAYRNGRPVVDADLADAGDQWPQFAPRAVLAGFRSVHAIPLRLRDTTIGAMNLFSDGTGSLAAGDANMVQALVDIATEGLLQERPPRHGEALAERLRAALQARIVIEQAKGAVAQTHAITVESAFDLLRGHARATRTGLSSVAQSLLDDPDRIKDVNRAG
jgi:hypothetical protein